jgi:hypothetical protein
MPISFLSYFDYTFVFTDNSKSILSPNGNFLAISDENSKKKIYFFFIKLINCFVFFKKKKKKTFGYLM